MNITSLIQAAINEDIPTGDLTTESLKVKTRNGDAHLVAKEDLLISGSIPFEKTIKTIEPGAKIQWNYGDGDAVLKGQIVAVITGNLVKILQAERISLNFIGHLSGIATLTGCFVKAIEGTGCTILDTRKTLPGYRELEKQAVVHGGGKNHRLNLSESVLIKENHIQVAGGIKQAVDRIRSQTRKPIELEVKNIEEAKMAIELKVERIMLDNMSLEDMATACKIIPASIESEASGNMNLNRVRAVAELGVNYISVGALTHSAPCADFSMLFLWDECDEQSI